jgi:hypothetical protein
MNCTTRLGVVAIFGFGLLTGCSSHSTPDANASADTGVPEIKETDPAGNPIAKAAYDFLDAVIKGDTQRASGRLTPKAMQRIVESGKQFSPPGLDKASFKIGEVIAPSKEQAIVQCILTDASDGTPHSEEMCCLLRNVDNDWRISGIAYGTTPDRPWTLSDFETGQNSAIPRQTMGGMASNQGSGAQPASTSTQASAGMQQTMPAVTGAPPVAAPTSSPYGSAAAGLGMPAVAPAVQYPNTPQSQPPYTAQGQQGADRR